jgi:hypothetical protein
VMTARQKNSYHHFPDQNHILMWPDFPMNWSVQKLSKEPGAGRHACNPRYSGGRNQEDRGSKPTRANSLWDPISKIPTTKRAGGVAQGIGPEFKYCKKSKTKETSPRKVP